MARVPSLGPRGEGWVVAQFAVGASILALGVAGPRWPGRVGSVLVVVGVALSVVGLALFVAGIVSLGGSLTPFPAPSERSTLQRHGAYRLVRHPIYGGLLVLALGWSLARSALALLGTAALALLLEFKSRREETLLVGRYPDYEAYRHHVRWRFVPWVR